MSTLGINFTGLASGIDTDSIIKALLAVERRPITLLQQRKTSLQSQKSLFGDLNSRLEALQDAVKAIRTSGEFLEFTAGTDTDEFLTASAGPGAAKGTHTVEVLQLAQGKVISSLGKADKDTTTYGTGTLQLTVKEGTPSESTIDITIDSSNNTLEGIAAAINAKDAGVQATVLDTGSGAEPYQLVLTATDTGTDNNFSLGTDVDATAELIAIASEIDGNVIAAAVDAQADINGITVTRSSNIFSDVIPGVTLNLNKPTNDPGSPGLAENQTRITVGTDASATADKIKKFVDAYNDIVDFIEGQNEVSEEGEAANPLFGDFTLRTIRSTLRSIVGSVVDNGDGDESYDQLSLVGVTSDSVGRLTFNQGDFEDALNDDSTSVRDLFTYDTDGIAEQLYTIIDSFTDTADGIIKARTDSFNDEIRRTDRQIGEKEARLEQFEDRQRERFAALESLMSQLQSQGAALSAFSFPSFG
ncbi:MAG: flagellar filament capping protein FliD [Planctomycetota bacterium]|jgi:flagellar hook-associated protein 2